MRVINLFTIKYDVTLLSRRPSISDGWCVGGDVGAVVGGCVVEWTSVGISVWDARHGN